MIETIPSPIIEPKLPMSEIQGIAVPGFLKQHHSLLGIRFPQGNQSMRHAQNALRGIADQLSTARATLDDRRNHRKKRAEARLDLDQSVGHTVLVAAAFSYQGLRKLTPGTDAIPSIAFRQGLAARSGLLGDPLSGDGSVSKWVVGGPGREMDALLVIAGDRRIEVTARAEKLRTDLEKGGIDVFYEEEGDVRDDEPGHEHFGFDDGVSQPGIRGRASEAEDDFITDRHIASSQQPEHSLFGYPGQDLVWPGVFLLGQPGTSPDPLVPGVDSEAVPLWTRNGSFLVFRRLVQDVGLFWRTMRDQAQTLSQQPGFTGLTDEKLAALLIGRWRSGAPVNRVPLGDEPGLGSDPCANNHFRFDSNSAAFELDPSYTDKYPMSVADPAGVTCPWAAHIRKVNTRDSGSDTGARDSTYSKRLLRVGVPFGKPLAYKDRYSDKSEDNEYRKRGLLFLSIQASIEEQFEFLMARWMGDPSRPKLPGGHDIVVGQNDTPGEKRVRRCVLFGANVEQAEVRTDAQWIVPTGGGYFFVPSISCLREILS